jgi:hypothetical protein
MNRCGVAGAIVMGSFDFASLVLGCAQDDRERAAPARGCAADGAGETKPRRPAPLFHRVAPAIVYT